MPKTIRTCKTPGCENHVPKKRQYCSKSCLFWSKFDRAAPGGCWLWTGSVDKSNGYGIVNADMAGGKRTKPHRLAYRLHYGVDPGELHVLHRCDVRLCGCPDHLFLGTPRDNRQDAIDKGRKVISLPGEQNVNAKLNDADVRAIRRSAAPIADLVRQYGRGWTTIRQVLRRETWGHVDIDDDAADDSDPYLASVHQTQESAHHGN